MLTKQSLEEIGYYKTMLVLHIFVKLFKGQLKIIWGEILFKSEVGIP